MSWVCGYGNMCQGSYNCPELCEAAGCVGMSGYSWTYRWQCGTCYGSYCAASGYNCCTEPFEPGSCNYDVSCG